MLPRTHGIGGMLYLVTMVTIIDKIDKFVFILDE